MKYICFDVETPNFRNDRMSSVGITVVENGVIVDEEYHLVDPETYFDSFNVRLTGISPETVAGEPSFPKLWAEIEPVMSGGLLIAHNAPFDIGVLTKCLQYYGIRWKPCIAYACTCRMSRKAFPELPNHKLDTVSEYLGLELDHHNAASDSNACAGILISCMEKGIDPAKFTVTREAICV